MPRGVADSMRERNGTSLENLVRETEARAESPKSPGTSPPRAWKRACGKGFAGRRARESDSQESRALAAADTDRSGHAARNELGWPNTYTFTKSISESLIRNYMDRTPGAAIAVVRPSIVESSMEKPFLGWNEGINTSASLSYLLGTFFRQLPTNETQVPRPDSRGPGLRGMTLIAAALVTRRHERVYHLATSVANPCDMRRSIELTGLGHRKFYRAQNGFQQRMRLKFDAIPVSKSRYDKLSAPAQKAVVQAINRSIEPIPFVRPPLARQERDLEKVIKLVALFEPFILHNDHVFEAMNIEQLSAALPAGERAEFGYDARSIDWWDYWINVHIPALRKWCYPLIEGRHPEARPRRSVPLAAHTEVSAAGAAGKSPATTP